MTKHNRIFRRILDWPHGLADPRRYTQKHSLKLRGWAEICSNSHTETGSWRKLDDQELRILFPKYFKTVASRNMRQAGHVEREGWRKLRHENLKKRHRSENNVVALNDMIILKWILIMQDGRVRTGLTWFRPLSGVYKNGNEPLGSVKTGNFLPS